MEDPPNASWNSWFGLQWAKDVQTRFSYISKLNEETVAGIRDNTLGKHGKNVVRFDTGAVSGTGPHINLDPKGYPNRSMPPVEVPSSVVTGAEYTQWLVQSASTVLSVFTYGAMLYRTWNAGKADYDKYQMELKKDVELEQAILYRMRHNDLALEVYPEWLDETRKPIQLKPVNTGREIGAIAGAKAVGTLGALAASNVGSWIGGTVGMTFGPAGALVGTMAGTTLGAVAGAVPGSSYGAKQGRVAADMVLDKFDLNDKSQ